MRPAAAIKRLGAAIAILSGVALSAQAVLADDCTQACADQWQADRDACQQTLNNELAQLDQDAANCLSNPDPIAAGQCIHDVNVKRFAAQNRYRQCISRANTTAYNCYRACQNSQSKPQRSK